MWTREEWWDALGRLGGEVCELPLVAAGGGLRHRRELSSAFSSDLDGDAGGIHVCIQLIHLVIYNSVSNSIPI